MKTLRIILPCLLLVTSLRAAAPRLYVTGQIGWFKADAGSLAALGSPLPDPGNIKSGTKMFSDVSMGAELLDWLSLEAGYVDFSSFVSPDYTIGMPVMPQALWETYDLRGFRLTPIFKIFSNDHVTFKVLGGLIHSTGRVITRDRFLPGYERSRGIDNGYHLGVGVACNLAKQTTLEGRIVYYDFGKPDSDPNRITATTYSLGLSWHF